MSEFDDEWIRKHRSIDPKILHALGFINVLWNACEHAILPLFRLVITKLNGRESLILTHDMGDVTLINKIRELLAIRTDFSPEERAMILSALDAYDVNRINRNQLSHFTPFPLRETSSEDKGFQFYRRKGPQFLVDAIPSDLASIRRVGDDLVALASYFNSLARYFQAKTEKSLISPPGILPLPERLWTPPPPNPQGRKAQPDKEPG